MHITKMNIPIPRSWPISRRIHAHVFERLAWMACPVRSGVALTWATPAVPVTRDAAYSTYIHMHISRCNAVFLTLRLARFAVFCPKCSTKQYSQPSTWWVCEGDPQEHEVQDSESVICNARERNMVDLYLFVWVVLSKPRRVRTTIRGCKSGVLA